MNFRKALFLFALLPLAACSGIRPHDGVVGYEATHNTAGTLRVAYTAEAKKSWEKLERKALQVCGQELQQPMVALRFQVVGKDELVKEVPIAFRVPVGMTNFGTPADAMSGDGMVQHTVFQRQTGTQSLKLKKISIDCAVK